MRKSLLELPRLIGSVTVVALFSVAVIAQTGGLKGRVRANSGRGISNASVIVTKGTSEIKTARSGADGNFQIEGIEPGFYSLRVEADGFAPGTMFSVEVKKGKVRDLGERLFLKVDEGTQVILRGSVFFKEGTSVTAAKVEVERVNADGTTRNAGSVFSSVSGEFVFRLPGEAGKYRVTAKYKDSSASKEIVVENPAVYRMAISLNLSSKDK